MAGGRARPDAPRSDGRASWDWRRAPPACPGALRSGCRTPRRARRGRSGRSARPVRISAGPRQAALGGLGALRLGRHPTANEVAGIVPRMLVEVALVIVLGSPEIGRRRNLGHDLAVEELLRLFLRFLGQLFLLAVVEEDVRPVL